VRQECLGVSGAWDAVRPDATVAASQALPKKKPAAGAGKSAAPELDVRAWDGLQSGVLERRTERPPLAALCKLDADQSAA